MSADKPLSSPWKEFLAEIDGLLEEPLYLHCIGGFVIAYFYGSPAYGITMVFEDLLIGATASHLGYAVATLNIGDFQRIHALSVAQV